MNNGDYMKPDYDLADKFCSYAVPTPGNSFEGIFWSVLFEEATKCRQGAVLFRSDEIQCVPIVWTTSKYTTQAQSCQSIHSHLAREI